MVVSSPRCLPVVTFALVAIGSVACSLDVRGSEVSSREEKRFTVSANAPVDLNVRTFDGTISIRSWDRNEVLVEIERVGVDQASAEALVVNQSQDGNRIVIEAPGGRNQRNLITLGSWITPAVNFVVTAPRRLALQAHTSDGMIETRDLEGTIDMNSGDGRVVASNVQGEIRAHTGDGSIRIDQAEGRVEADSGDGSIEIGGRLEALTVRTGDGSVSVDASQGSLAKGDWRITTGDGGITMRIPDNFNAAVDASSGDGSVRVEGINPPPTDDGEPPRRVVGQLGSGGATLMLRTGDGSIDVGR
jgi:hypothetical protein